jgi:hypothetical protein
MSGKEYKSGALNMLGKIIMELDNLSDNEKQLP